MWQGITVVLIVTLSALYIIWRYWKKFKADKSAGLDYACGCESCKERAGCPFDQQTVIRSNKDGTNHNSE